MNFDPIKNQMICMLCHKRFKSLKLDTIKKHHRSQHLGVVEYPSSKKRLFVLKYEAEQNKQQGQLRGFLDPQRKIALASYKLAYIVSQTKKPISDYEHYVEFAMAADPDSDVFKQMASSRRTINRKTIEIHGFLKRELRDDICKALFWSYVLDESTDKSVTEEVIVYARFVNIAKGEVITRFLAVAPVQGHPVRLIYFQLFEK